MRSLEALLVRAEAARALVRQREMDGYDALAMVIMPSEPLRAASFLAKPTRDVTRMANYLIEGKKKGRRKRRPSVPQRPAPRRSVSIDELLASL